MIAIWLRERFTREARSVARLSHRNIIVVYEIGEDQGQPFMAMEYIAGETLKQVLKRTPTPPITKRLSLIEDLCDGLAHAHAQGIIHRDIKPANIMLTQDGQVKIADFGIARLENSSMTQVGTLMGTPSYMAPEQFRGETVDLRADIWAAGVVLYQLLTGDKPFEGGFTAVIGLTPPPVVVWVPIQAGPNPIPLPIPLDPSLAGRSVFGQSFHVDGSGAVSSPGIRISIL